MHVFYGKNDTFIDVTDAVLTSCFDGVRIHIPRGDLTRAEMFSDPVPGVVKDILLVRPVGRRATCVGYGPETDVDCWLTPEELQAIRPLYDRPDRVAPPSHLNTAEERLDFVHRQLRFLGGSLEDEKPEQTMVARFLDPRAKVLEIGANVGRNTMMIASILDDERYLVTMECDPDSVEVLRNNRYLNNFRFHIEPSALSYRKLIQRGWDTIPSDEVLPGYQPVRTITFEQLTDKFRIDFDTLVADCEGALYYILNDSDAMLSGISTVILEADYHTAEQKRSVEAILLAHGLQRVHSEPLVTDWAHPFPEECAASFFEVWKKAGGTTG